MTAVWCDHSTPCSWWLTDTSQRLQTHGAYKILPRFPLKNEWQKVVLRSYRTGIANATITPRLSPISLLTWLCSSMKMTYWIFYYLTPKEHDLIEIKRPYCGQKNNVGRAQRFYLWCIQHTYKRIYWIYCLTIESMPRLPQKGFVESKYGQAFCTFFQK